MSDRVYLLLDVIEGKAGQVAGQLRSISGIRLVDVIEGQPDVIALIEAPERKKAADLVMQAISSVEDMIEDMKLLPARKEIDSRNSNAPSYHGKKATGNMEYA